MPLINREGLCGDPWVRVADEAALPEATHVIVTLERWRKEREALLGRGGPFGIRLQSDQPPDAIEADLIHFGLIALEFPQFKDGRAYSYARLLRERYGFKGELRATGNVLRDQLFFMLRCGFDSFEIPEKAKVEEWLKAFDEISVVYQPTPDGRRTALQLRR